MVNMKKKATDILEDYSNYYSQVDLEKLTKFLEQIKSEAIREFAKRLKEKLQWDVEFDNKLVFESDIDNLVKEMTEENK